MTAAVEIFEESGLDAVSMRSVSARLGVSPVPLYSRIGNKEALVDAIADRLLANLAPPAPKTRRGTGTRCAGPASSGAAAAGPRQPAHPVAGTRRLRRGVAPTGRGHARRRDVRRRRRAGVPPPHVGNRRLRRGGVRGRATSPAADDGPAGWRPGRRRRRRSRHAVRHPHPVHHRRHHRAMPTPNGLSPEAPDDEDGGGPMTHPEPGRDRQGRRRHRRQQGPRAGHGAGVRRGGRRCRRGQPEARTVRGGRRRDPRPGSSGTGGALPRRPTGTTVPPSSTPPSPTSAGSTCWSTTPASRRCRRHCWGSPAELFDKTIGVNLKGPLRLTGAGRRAHGARRLDHQHQLQGVAAPHRFHRRLRRGQGRPQRADQGGGRRVRPARESVSTPSCAAPSTPTASTPRSLAGGAGADGRPSPSAGSPPPRRSSARPSFWPASVVVPDR